MHTYSYSNTNQGYKQSGFSVKITPMYRLFSLFLLGCLVLILPACGGSPKDNDAATGSISFKLQPPDDQSSTASGASPLMQAAMLDCNKYSGISVEALVYDENDVLITQGGPWDCIAGEGIIYGVTAGTDRSVRVNLRSISGAVVLTGNKLGITVIDGQIADTGYIQLVRPPVVESEAADDSATVTRGGTVTVLNSGARSVLLNDNGEGLSVVTTPIAGPLYGSLTLRSDGTFSYTQDGSNATSDSFVYRVLDIFGKEDTATVTITINPNPNNAPVLSGPGVSPSSGLTTDTFTYSVRYTDQDGDSPGSAVVYIDGSAHTMALASGLTSNGAYTFSTTLGAGSHTYYFSFTDGKGGSARQPESGSIDGPTVTASLCNAEFTVAASSTPLTMNFTDKSSGVITSRAWAFGDGSTDSAQNPSHTYAAGGTYTVTLAATGDCGPTTRTYPVTVCSPPVASFTSLRKINSLVVSFRDTSTGTPTTWSWDFGDGTTSTAQNTGHTYSAPGDYTVTLVVGNSCVWPSTPHVVTQKVYQAIVFVDPVNGQSSYSGRGWGSAKPTIQEAIDAASEGDRVWVKGGTYLLTSTIQVNKPVSLYGHFKGTETSLSSRDIGNESFGTIVDGQSRVRCFAMAGTAKTVVIDGFTIQNGYVESEPGGGILNYRIASTLTVTNCVLRNNSSSQGGGGVYNFNDFDDNSALYVDKCTFDSNSCSTKYNGGGIYSRTVNTDIRNSTLRNNNGGNGGGISCMGMNTHIANCVLNGNSASSYGGGISIQNSNNASITNCTLYNNIGTRVGGVYSNISTLEIQNTIFYSNSSNSDFPSIWGESSSLTVDYCALQENIFMDSYNNLHGQNPDFNNAANGDFSLTINSPCVDMGNDGAANELLTDIAGNPRNICGVDMGAYELDHICLS